MSVHVMSWVLKHSPVSVSGHRLVLLVLADKANDDGGGAYPKRSTIASEAKVSEREVGYALKALEAAGQIAREGTAGKQNRTVIWRVEMAESIRQDLPDSPAASPATSAGSVRQPLPDPRVEPSEEPSDPPISSTDGSGREDARERDTAWQLIDQAAHEELGDFTHHTAIEPCRLLYREGDKLVVGAPEHIASWVDERYTTMLAAIASRLARRPIEIQIVTATAEALAKIAPPVPTRRRSTGGDESLDAPPEEDAA